MVIPRNPILAKSLISSSGGICSLSRLCAVGRSLSSANWRTVSRTIFCSSVGVKFMLSLRARRSRVLVEPAARLPSQPARLDQLAQERAGPVLRVAEPFVQNLEDVEADVESDQVRERERPHRVVHAELHDGVDRLARRNAF